MKKEFLKIRDIRAEHIDKKIKFRGEIKQVSEIRPQVVTAKFKCPKCRAILSVLQIDKKLREPCKCKCGCEEFDMLSKEFVDSQRIIVEELKEELDKDDKKHYSRRINVFLREDLCLSSKQKIIKPGNNIIVKGFVREVPVPLEDGAISTRFDLALEANSIEKM